mgnify:CR=1 FL=1
MIILYLIIIRNLNLNKRSLLQMSFLDYSTSLNVQKSIRSNQGDDLQNQSDGPQHFLKIFL